MELQEINKQVIKVKKFIKQIKKFLNYVKKQTTDEFNQEFLKLYLNSQMTLLVQHMLREILYSVNSYTEDIFILVSNLLHQIRLLYSSLSLEPAFPLYCQKFLNDNFVTICLKHLSQVFSTQAIQQFLQSPKQIFDVIWAFYIKFQSQLGRETLVVIQKMFNYILKEVKRYLFLSKDCRLEEVLQLFSFIKFMIEQIYLFKKAIPQTLLQDFNVNFIFSRILIFSRQQVNTLKFLIEKKIILYLLYNDLDFQNVQMFL